MTKPEEYDAIIIGASRAALFLSPALVQAGLRTALVEREFLGGVCVNVGCTPTKTMIASARVAHLARRAAEYGVRTGPVTVDLADVRQRKRDLVNGVRMFPQTLIERTEGLDLVMGEASFVDSKAVEVRLNDDGVRQLTAERIFIDTGARPGKPPIPGLDSVPALDSTSIMELEALPEHLLVLGGGYVGLEFSQMFRRFGSQVTIIGRGKQLLRWEDPDVAEEVRKILSEDGIEVLLDTQTLKAEQTGSDQLQLSVKTPEGEHTLTGSHLLVATGRVPNTERLNLEAAGVRTDDRGLIEVNERLETNVPGIYALGDVRQGPAFTHMAFDDMRVLRNNLLMEGNATTTGRLVPYTVFIDPQLGRVGLTETEARAQGRNIRVAKLPMNYPGATRARELGETRGLMKAIVDADTDQILGAAILAVEGGEMMAVLQVAMMGKLPYTAIRDGIFTHPTLAEMLSDLFTLMDMPMPMPD
jgi:pyruvate/2-oxoglutarate dehydrogenase complex dihydrolipoamide dehydrogenase (E3) component